MWENVYRYFRFFSFKIILTSKDFINIIIIIIHKTILNYFTGYFHIFSERGIPVKMFGRNTANKRTSDVYELLCKYLQ